MMSEQKTYLGFKGNLWILLVINALIVVALIWHFKSYEANKEQEAMLNKSVTQKPAPEKTQQAKQEKPSKPTVKKQVATKETTVKETATKTPKTETTKILKTYLVQEGDSYASLAQTLGISSQDLYQLNHGMPLDTGVLIMLPDGPATSSDKELVTTTLNDSKKQATTLTKEKVKKEAKKKIPTTLPAELPTAEAKNTEVLYHTVVKGDTLYSIGKKYKLSVDELVKLNGLSQSQANLGQKLVVSQTLTTASDQPLKPEPLTVEVGTPVVQTQAQWHTVSKGETLWGISQKYKISVDELKKLNNISNNQVNIGQKLQVK